MTKAKKTEAQEFVGWRSIFWPIHSFELKKFLPMALMMMCILFNYSVLRGTKDSLVITSMGAEAIPTLKLWFVLPSAVLFMIIYSKLSNIFSKNTVFYIVVFSFLVYFALFALVLYPYHCSLHFDFSNIEGDFLKGLLKPIGSWTFSSFYIMAELWGSSMVSLMFWRFANDVTSLKESKRFYSMFGFIANGALIVSGTFLKSGSDEGSAGGEWAALPILMSVVVASCLVIAGIYYWLNKSVLTDPRFFDPNEIKKPKKKEKLSLSDSFKYILSSKYLGFIAMLIICYGVSINLVEVTWKAQARLLYPTKDAFNSFMGGVQIYTGIATIIFMLIGANVLRRCSWFTAAITTPLMFFVTGLMFFGFIIFQNSISSMFGEMSNGAAVLGVIVAVGLIQNVLSKGVKYSLFDSTKEMSYIPLDDELKSKGKAAVDVIGGRLGKSGGAAIQFLLLNIIFVGSSLVELAPVIATTFIVILALWFLAVSGLNKEFLKITATDKK
jgi:AAA family ATP:ADP antiporter